MGGTVWSIAIVYAAGGNLNRIDIGMASNTLTISKEKNERLESIVNEMIFREF